MLPFGGPISSRSSAIANPIAAVEETLRRELTLHACATAVERDQALHCEMKDGNVTLQDGLNDEKW